MRIYATSKNTGPSWNSDPLHLVYLGTNLDKALEAVGDFRRYEISHDRPHFTRDFPELKSAIPRDLEREMIRYFAADGWWYSVVAIDLVESQATCPFNPENNKKGAE